MAQHVQNPRPGGSLQEAYNLVGPIPVAVDGYVVPVAIVDDLSKAGYSPTTRRVQAAFSQAAVAGEYSGFRLETPPGIIATIKGLTVQSSVATRLRCRVGSQLTAPGNLADARFVDGRLRALGMGPAAVLSYDTQVAALTGSSFYLEARVNGTVDYFHLDWTIGGYRDQYDFFDFQMGVVNRDVTVGMEWVETTVP